MSSKCNRCNADITWKKPFTQGDRPLNLDNSVHSCAKKETTPTGITDNALSSSVSLAECEAFHIKFKDLTDSKYDSTARIYNTLRMRR